MGFVDSNGLKRFCAGCGSLILVYSEIAWLEHITEHKKREAKWPHSAEQNYPVDLFRTNPLAVASTSTSGDISSYPIQKYFNFIDPKTQKVGSAPIFPTDS